jgi:hypothetical protein
MTDLPPDPAPTPDPVPTPDPTPGDPAPVPTPDPTAPIPDPIPAPAPLTPLQQAFKDIGDQLNALGADDSALQATVATMAPEAEVTALTARVAALEAAPGGTAPDMSQFALKTDLANVAHMADLQGVLHTSDLDGLVKPTDLEAYAKSDDVKALGGRIGVIETGVVGLDPGTFTRASHGAPGVVVISPTVFPVAPAAGVAFAATLSGSGGAFPYNFTIESGALPMGLMLASGGAITGTPTRPDPNSAVPWTVVIRATDANGVVGRATYSGQY